MWLVCKWKWLHSMILDVTESLHLEMYTSNLNRVPCFPQRN